MVQFLQKCKEILLEIILSVRYIKYFDFLKRKKFLFPKLLRIMSKAYVVNKPREGDQNLSIVFNSLIILHIFLGLPYDAKLLLSSKCYKKDLSIVYELSVPQKSLSSGKMRLSGFLLLLLTGPIVSLEETR